jgi:hypothetical protein
LKESPKNILDLALHAGTWILQDDLLVYPSTSWPARDFLDFLTLLYSEKKYPENIRPYTPHLNITPADKRPVRDLTYMRLVDCQLNVQQDMKLQNIGPLLVTTFICQTNIYVGMTTDES